MFKSVLLGERFDRRFIAPSDDRFHPALDCVASDQLTGVTVSAVDEEKVVQRSIVGEFDSLWAPILFVVFDRVTHEFQPLGFHADHHEPLWELGPEEFLYTLYIEELLQLRIG